MELSFSDLNFPSLSIVSHLLMEDVGWEGPKVLRLQGVSWTTQSAVASPHAPTLLAATQPVYTTATQ